MTSEEYDFVRRQARAEIVGEIIAIALPLVASADDRQKLLAALREREKDEEDMMRRAAVRVADETIREALG